MGGLVLNFYSDRNILSISGRPLLDRWPQGPYVLVEPHHLATLPPHREISRVEDIVLIQAVEQ